MSSFFWNIRGLNKSSKHSVVQSWIHNSSLKFGCILETRVRENKSRKIIDSIFRDWSLISNYEDSDLGRIWVVWRDGVRLTPMFKSGQIITCSVQLENREDEFFCSFIYASNFPEERRSLWQDLKSHYNSPIFKNKAWIVYGDFNEILSGSEHSGYDSNPILSQGTRDFQDVVSYCSLLDLGFNGPQLTWCNKRDEGLICKKLDRVLVNGEWLQAFPNSYSIFEAGGCSDHLRCRIHLDAPVPSARRPFKFVNALVDFPNFKPLVEEFWAGTEELFHSTSAMFRFSKKLKALKPLLRDLQKQSMGNITRRTKEAYEHLCVQQEHTLLNPTSSAIQSEAEAQSKWNQLADIEEKFLRQKSKLQWMQVGDRNNKVFHRAATVRQAKNMIREIHCSNGSVATSAEDIKIEAESYFRDFLTQKPADFVRIGVEPLSNLLDFSCSQEDQNWLTREISDEEVKCVIFSMPNDKSPGPDGFTSEFFKGAWQVIGKDFTVAIQSFFKFGFLPKGINTTILALIPKKEDAKQMKDYRPISCCNVFYKVISKILSNRLKDILPKFVAPNQSAFVQNRLLIENLLLASELVKDYHKSSISSRSALKIDIAKAFDSIQWPFLVNTLLALNIPPKFVHWIHLCVSTASFSVQINGELAGFFRSERGLRQGCALSPYLFVICMNVLSKMLDKAASDGKFGYHPSCKSILLTHLCFADDLMVFTDGRIRSMEGIISVFDEFGKMSGLKISLEKSTAYLAGVTTRNRQVVESHFPFAVGQLPVRYLGLPLLTKRMTSTDYAPLLERIRSKIRSWTARYLSFAGRLQLISSVLTNVTSFWLSAFRLPQGCIDEINSLCSSFLWSGPDLSSRKAKISWNDVCRPKSEGGLGLKQLKEANTVCILKLIWRILSGKSLWAAWIHRYLLRQGSFWSIREGTARGSWIWRKLLKYREQAKTFHKMEVKSGSSTSFWFDNWSEHGCLFDTIGPRGCIDLGISTHATVATVLAAHRRRRHRSQLLNLVEEQIEVARLNQQSNEEDKHLWRDKEGSFKSKFSTKSTWNKIRSSQPKLPWTRGVWFSQAVPKFSFLAWLAMHDRLSTGDRALRWRQNISTTCVLCHDPMETRSHLFFTCRFSSEIWSNLARGVLRNQFTTDWAALTHLISHSLQDRMTLFVTRFLFQAAIHAIWRERNQRKHGEPPSTAQRLIQLLDKTMRNRLLTLQRSGNKHFTKGLLFWFASKTTS